MSVLNEHPPVETGVLSPHQFAAQFKPAYYGADWNTMHHSREFREGGDQGTDMHTLTESVAAHGVHSPVEVIGDEVRDGHHRVVAAMHTGKDIPYERW